MLLNSKRKNLARIVAAASSSVFLTCSPTYQFDVVELDFPATGDVRDGLKSNICCGKYFTALKKGVMALPSLLPLKQIKKVSSCGFFRSSARLLRWLLPCKSQSASHATELLQKTDLEAVKHSKSQKVQEHSNLQNVQEHSKPQNVQEHSKPQNVQSRGTLDEEALRYCLAQANAEQEEALLRTSFKKAAQEKFEGQLQLLKDWDFLFVPTCDELIRDIGNDKKLALAVGGEVPSKMLIHAIARNNKAAFQTVLELDTKFPFKIEAPLKQFFPDDVEVINSRLLNSLAGIGKMPKLNGTVPDYAINSLMMVVERSLSEDVTVRVNLKKIAQILLDGVEESQKREIVFYVSSQIR